MKFRKVSRDDFFSGEKLYRIQYQEKPKGRWKFYCTTNWPTDYDSEELRDHVFKKLVKKGKL